MKRHPALIPLSREHLNALILVTCLKKGEYPNPKYPWPKSPEAQREKVYQMWCNEMSWHFKAEERFFFKPFFQQLSPEMQALTRSLLEEHQVLEQCIHDFFQLSGDPLLKALKQFGEQLEVHVRKEERDYYEGLAREISDQQLMKGHQQLEAFYAQRAPNFCIFTGKPL